MLPSLAISLILAAATGQGAASAPDQVEVAPPNFPGGDIVVDERLGASVPLDTPLRDQSGKDTTLGELIAGDMPTILTFNYSTCPNLCSLQLNNLVDALPGLSWKVGQQFRIVTLVIDPDEPAATTRATHDRYVGRLPAGSLAVGWTFATGRTPGDGSSIKRIADAVGFRYRKIPETGEWGHPATLVFLSHAGRVTRYVNGVGYDADTMMQSIARAGIDEASATAGFLLRCFHWDPDANNYSRMGATVLRYAAAGFLVLLVAVFGFYRLIRRRQRHPLGDRP